MIAALTRPIRPAWALLSCMAACAAVAVYCLAYNALAGGRESVGEAIGWALAMIVPWLAAIEAQKRTRSGVGIAVILLAALGASLLLGALVLSQPIDQFALVRRLPALIAAAAVILSMRSLAPRDLQTSPSEAIDPTGADWVRAAGNYVEVMRGGRARLHRATISAAERQLSDHGFVRVHRSALVRRDRIARVRAVDVLLVDGTSVRVGKRYRANLDL